MEEISLDEMIDVYDQYSEKFEDVYDEDIVYSDSLNDYDRLIDIIRNVKKYYELNDVENMQIGSFADYVRDMVLG